MINFNNIYPILLELEDSKDDIFNLLQKNKQVFTIFEDNDIEISFVLTKQITTSRYFYASLKFKKYKSIQKDSNIQIKVDHTKPLSEFLDGFDLTQVVESCTKTCNINGLEETNFILNGYSFEISKNSNRYVTITEHINAVVFTKRFSSLQDLFNYINFRKQYHKDIHIGFNVPENEVDNIKRNIEVLKTNSESIYTNMISEILCDKTYKKIDIDDIDFSRLKKINDNINFDISYTNKDDDVYSLSCSYNTITGMTTQLPKGELNKEHIESYCTLLYIINRIDSGFSGKFIAYVNIILQYKKFMSKITPSHNNSKVKQVSPDKVCTQIVKTLASARLEKSMDSDIIEITPYNDFSRFIRLEGVMKNRKRCTLAVYAKHGKTVFEEYRIIVEKNRIDDDCIDFLKQYFI